MPDRGEAEGEVRFLLRRERRAAFSTAEEKRLGNGDCEVHPAFARPPKWKSRVVTTEDLLIPDPGTRSENGLSRQRNGEGSADLTSPAGQGSCCRTKGAASVQEQAELVAMRRRRARGRGPEGGPAGTEGHDEGELRWGCAGGDGVPGQRPSSRPQ